MSTEQKSDDYPPEEYIEKYDKWFWEIQKASLSCKLKKRLQGSITLEWVFLLIPIVLFVLNAVFLDCDGVLYSNESTQFTYARDLSNSLVLSGLYFISYFFSPYYSNRFRDFLLNDILLHSSEGMNIIKDADQLDDDSSKTSSVIMILALAVGVIIGFAFFSFTLTGNADPKPYWIVNLKLLGRIFYIIFLGITWSQSILFVFMVFCANLVITRCVMLNSIKYTDEFFSDNRSTIDISDLLSYSFTYGMFYILAGILFIINDRMAVGLFQLHNAFSYDPACFVLVILLISLLCWAAVPLRCFLVFMEKKRNILLKKIENQYQQQSCDDIKVYLFNRRNDVMKQKALQTTLTLKLTLITTLMIPVAGIIIQIISLFKR